jgi:uncharacterized protein with NAD-binding domain and iron-sulfur cluster
VAGLYKEQWSEMSQRNRKEVRIVRYNHKGNENNQGKSRGEVSRYSNFAVSVEYCTSYKQVI